MIMVGVARLARRNPLPAATTVLSVAVATWFAVGLAHEWSAPIVGWLPLPAIAALAALSCWQAAATRGLAEGARPFWHGMGVAMLLIGAGTASNTVDALTGPHPPDQQVSPLTLGLYLVGVLVTLWSAVRLRGSDRGRGEWLRFALDAATVMITVALFVWHFLFRNLDEWWAVDSSVVPLVAVVALTFVSILAVLKVSFVGLGPVDRTALRILTLATATSGIGGALSPLLADRPYLTNTHLTVPIGGAFLAWAAARQRRAATEPVPEPPGRRRRLFSLIPYTAVAATDSLLFWAPEDDPTEFQVVAAAAVALTAIVVVRQITALVENSRLLARVDASLEELRRSQDRLAYHATHDDLTQLANRTLFEQRIREATDGSGPGASACVALVDLDDFKDINDRLGHTIGDAVLTVVARRLRASVRPQDTVARLGGDEFAVLLTDAGSGGSQVLDRVAATLQQPIHAGGHDLFVAASMGVVDSEGLSDPGELLRRADVAMYSAKDAGKGRWASYHPDIDQRTAEDAELGARLRTALDRAELHLLYQPIVELPTGRMVGVEALIRWHHREHGLIRPDRFIPVAERNGLIVPIGRWVLAEACRRAALWREIRGGDLPFRISVNASARQLREPSFTADVTAALAANGLRPSSLTIEVTETAVFEGGRALQTLQEVHASGVRVALDDFGTGHSSLGLLRTCPVDVLKVDKSFVEGVTASGEQAVIVAALIGLADGLGLEAVAEGVETAGQAERLYQLGYRFAQGYHFARPLTVADIDRLIAPRGRTTGPGSPTAGATAPEAPGSPAAAAVSAPPAAAAGARP
jgi:diguanylate cyclase